jgi:lysozyme
MTVIKKRKTTYKKSLKILLIALSPIIIYCTYYFYQEIKSGYIKYKHFGVKIPSGYEMHGIDVSKYQNIINWKSVKNMKVQDVTIDFVFIKATQGVQTVDLKYYQNMLRARQADIPTGSYHFFLTYRDATIQANHFARIASIKKGDLPPVLDVEEEKGQSKEKIRAGVKTWLRLIEQKYNVKPILYTNAGFYERNLAGYFDDYTLWIAHYKTGKEPAINRNWTFWQHSEEAHINGIDGNVDFNVFNGSNSEFNELLIK